MGKKTPKLPEGEGTFSSPDTFISVNEHTNKILWVRVREELAKRKGNFYFTVVWSTVPKKSADSLEN